MNKQIVIFVVGVAVFAVGYVAQNFSVAAGDCQKPSENTKGCYSPDDKIGDCSSLDQVDCDLSGSWQWKIYEIEKFPQGVTESDSGLTTEESANCWRWSICKWDKEQKKCVVSERWSPWIQRWKTVVDQEGVCPRS